MKTYREWEQEANIGPGSDGPEAAYRAWQACAAEYQPRLDEAGKLAGEIKKRAKVAYDQDLADRIIDALGNK